MCISYKYLSLFLHVGALHPYEITGNLYETTENPYEITENP